MEQAKLRMLLENHHTSAYRWALFCCEGDRHEAEDVLQTVYLNLLERSASFEERSIFKTWLFSAVRNTASKAKRRLLRSLRHLQEAPTELPAVRPVSVESIYRSQLRTLMQQILSDLSQRQRQVLELVFYHDLTVEEAAGVMEVSVGSARTHYHRGKNRLKEEIEKSGLHHDDEVERHQDRALI